MAVRAIPNIKLAATDTGTEAADTAVVITYADKAGKAHILYGVVWSYSETPTGGGLKIEAEGVTVFEQKIAVGGPGAVYFDMPIGCVVGDALVVTLAAGAGTCVGKLNCIYKESKR